jgi:hypothetical protein
MRYQFLIDTYATERLKVLSVWSMFEDGDLSTRPHREDRRGRSVLEQMVHQCMSENLWFRTILGVDVGAPPIPEQETRNGFIRRYGEDSAKRLEVLRGKSDDWWEEEAAFFEVRRSRAWIMVGGSRTPHIIVASKPPCSGCSDGACTAPMAPPPTPVVCRLTRPRPSTPFQTRRRWSLE